MSSSEDVAAFIRYVRHQRLILDYLFISSTGLLFYDFILTFHLEVQHVWFSRWSYTKILFLLNRYLTFISTFFILHNQLFVDPPKETCTWTWPVASWLVVLKTVTSEIILAIRTWAVWNRNKVVGYVLVVVMAAYIVIQLVINRITLNSLKHAPPPYPGFRGCFIINAKNLIWLAYASLATVEVVFLTLMTISAVLSLRSGFTSDLWVVVHRDGILTYVYLLLITVANLAVSIAAAPDMQIMFTPHDDVLYTLLTARIIINLRIMGQEGVQTELHTTNYYRGGIQTVSDTPMEFAERERDGFHGTTTFEENSTRCEGGSSQTPAQ